MKAALQTLLEPDAGYGLLEMLEHELHTGVGTVQPDGSLHKVRSVLHRALLDPARHALGAPGKELRAQLIRLAHRIAGGRDGGPAVLPRLTEVLHAGSLIIDDVEDGSELRRGQPALHCVVGVPLAINTGNWLYFWALELVRELRLDDGRELEMYRQLTRTLSLAHRGQALDLAARVSELAQHEVASMARAISELKTGALMAFAARSGAIAAGASSARVEALGRFGLRLGQSLQRLDDVGGMLSARMLEKGLEDLRHERVTWAWAFLATRLDEQAYGELVASIGKDRQALERLRERMATELARLDAPREVREQLRRTRDLLTKEVSMSSECQLELAAQLEKLEGSYV